jgi:hypothetical protein
MVVQQWNVMPGKRKVYVSFARKLKIEGILAATRLNFCIENNLTFAPANPGDYNNVIISLYLITCKK